MRAVSPEMHLPTEQHSPLRSPFVPDYSSAAGPVLRNCTRFLHANSTGQRAHAEQALIVSSEVQHLEKFLIGESVHRTHLEQIW